jgi:hypothetical protein
MGKEEIKVHLGGGYQIRERGIFNLEKLYKEIHSSLEENGYEEFNEKKHAHKKLDRGDEIALEWEAEKEVTDFIKFRIEIDFIFKEIQPVSGELVSGFTKITFRAFVVPDYKEQWSSSRFKQFMYDLYTKIFYKDEMKRYTKKLDSEIKDVLNTAKEVLEFYR